jgi:hypothetical protein
MKGIIQKAIIDAYKKRKSLFVVKRYLRIKHKITISLDTLLKRFKNMPTINRGKEWD